MESFAIRRARPADAAALTACFAAAYAPFAGRIAGLPDVTGGLAEDIVRNQVWVAEAEGRVIGGAVLVIGAEAAHLANVAVDPEAAGKGAGRALIAAVEAAARTGGHDRLRLATHVDMPGNVALYRRLGWRETGREGAKVLMEKAL